MAQKSELDDEPSFGALLNSTPKGELARADEVIE